MGCGDSNVLNMSDSFNGAKFQNPTLGLASPTIPTPPLHLNHDHHDHGDEVNCKKQKSSGVELNHNQEQSFGGSTSSSSSRWNPTPKQLLLLEEMYRKGMRTPTSEQIHQMAAQLQIFGKIEGKNVFYWFQNHKARERQKLRREMETSILKSYCSNNDHQLYVEQHPDSGLRRTFYQEAEQTTNRVPLPHYTLLPPQEFVSMHRAAMPAEIGETRVWLGFDEKELQLRRGSNIAIAPDRHATWQMLNNLSRSSGPSPFTSPNKPLILNTNEAKLKNEKIQTLDLFPLHGSVGDDDDNLSKNLGMSIKPPSPVIDTNFNSSKFFEFLPLKNN